MVFYLWYASKTLSLPGHQLQNSEDHDSSPSRTQNRYDYTDLDVAMLEMATLEQKLWKQRHSVVKRQSSGLDCNRSLQKALTSCQDSVTLNATLLSDPSRNQSAILRTQFCGLGCRSKLFMHAYQCGVTNFLVEVSGDCKYGSQAKCIHAAVIFVDGVILCETNIDQGQTNDEGSASGAEENCKLSMTYSTEMKHRYLLDSQIGQRVLTPPLEPPWKNCSNFAFHRVTNLSTNAPVSSTVSPRTAPSSQTVSTRGGVSQEQLATTNSALRLYSQTYISVCFSIVLCSLFLSVAHL